MNISQGTSVDSFTPVTTHSQANVPPIMDAQKYQKMMHNKTCKSCNSRLKELKRQSVKTMIIEYNKMMLGNGIPSLDSLLNIVYQNLKLSEQYLVGTSNEICDVCGMHIDHLKKHSLLVLQTANLTPFLTYNMMNQQQEYSARNESSIRHPSRNTATYGESSNSINGKKVPGINQTADILDTKRTEMQDRATTAPTAAHFFTEAAKKFNIPNSKKKCSTKKKMNEEMDASLFETNFSRLISKQPPPNPPGLFKYMGRRVDGKVSVMLRIAPNENVDQTDSFIEVDQRRKQISMLQPKNVNVIPHKLQNPNNVPKLFAFDAIFEGEATQNRIGSNSLLDILHAVINGGEGCLLTYGSSNVGKTATMIGQPNSNKNVGVIPSAIAWMYSLIEDCKQRTGARISVRVSAVEVVGPSENLKDLLAEQVSGADSVDSSGASPGIYLRDDPIGGGVQLGNVSEPQAVSAEKAAFYLDAALAARSIEKDENGEKQSSHMIFTLHIYQYRVDKSYKSRSGGAVPYSGGRSRLHLIDLSYVNQKFKNMQNGVTPSQAGLGQIIVAMLNGFKQLPYRDSKITRLLKDSIGNPTCRTTLIAHVSTDEKHYSKTCTTIQTVSKIHRSRRKRNKYCSSSSDNSCDESRRRRPHAPLIKTSGIDDCGVNSDYNTSSAGEDSCDTVIYMGSNGNSSDRELSDNERPPSPDTINKIKLKLASSSEDESPDSRITPSTSDDEKQLSFILSNSFSEKIKSLEENSMKIEKEKLNENSNSSSDEKNQEFKLNKDSHFKFKNRDSLNAEKAVNVVAPLIIKSVESNNTPNKEQTQILRESDSNSNDEKAPSEKELRKYEKRIAKLLKENIDDDVSNIIDQQNNQYVCRTDGYTSDINKNVDNFSKHPYKLDGYVSAPENYRSKPVQIVKGTVRPSISAIKEIDSPSKLDILTTGLSTRLDSLFIETQLTNELDETCLDDICNNKIDDIEIDLSEHSKTENVFTESILSFTGDFLKEHQLKRNLPILNKRLSPINNLEHIITVSSVPNFSVVKRTLPDQVSSPTMRNKELSRTNVNQLYSNIPHRPILERSYSKEDTCSLLSVNESEYDSDICSTFSESPAINRTLRRPTRLKYRWSTVFEDDEKLNKATPKDNIKTPSKSPKPNKRFQIFSNSKSEVSTTPKANRKFNILSPKSERKLQLDSDASNKTTNNETSDKRMSACSDSSSGIGSNSSNSHSSSLQSREEVKIDYSLPEKTSKSRLWIFSRRSRKSRSYSTSGYVSDGNIIESSSARLSRRSKIFGSSRSKSSFYTDGHSSGYDTTLTEGDVTSCAEEMTDTETLVNKKKKRFLNFRRRSTSSINSSRNRVKRPVWLDGRRCISDDEGLQIKVYEIDDPNQINKHTRCKSEGALSSGHQKKVEALRKQNETLKNEMNTAALGRFPKQNTSSVQVYKKHSNESGRINGTNNKESLNTSNPFNNEDKDFAQLASNLEKENQSMGKKLKAIKNHIQVVTCFDGQVRKVTQI